MKGRRLLVWGASGHGKVVADAAIAQGWDVIGFADDEAAKRGLELLGVTVVAIGIEEVAAFCLRSNADVIVGIGVNGARKRVFERVLTAQVPVATVVHPSAVIARSVSIGMGSVVFGGVVLNPDTSLGRNIIVNTSASLDHDNVLADHTHVSPGAHLGGTVNVGEGTHIGIGATVHNNVDIGAWSVIGAGAVVVRNIPDQVVAYGVPARVVRPVNQ